MYMNDLWALSQEYLILLYANNKGTDQPAHPRSLTDQRLCFSLHGEYNSYPHAFFKKAKGIL